MCDKETEIKLNCFINILAPENLESNKVVSTFNEQLQANVNDLLLVEEINKIANNKETLLSLLKQLNFIECNEDKVKIKINDNMNLISLVNVPLSWEKNEIKTKFESLKGNESKIIRLYKKSLFWHLIVEDIELANKIEAELNSGNVKDEEGNKIKFEKTTSVDISKRINKQISNHAYSKEVSDLKSNNLGVEKSNVEAGSKLSWRKKSNDTSEEVRKGSRITSNYNAKQSGNFQRSSQLNTNNTGGGFFRERYNSDGQQNFYRSKLNKKEEIEIDLGKIHYSLKITNKYTNADLLLFYDKFRIQGVFNDPPKFEVFVDEICAKEKRKEFNFLKRERSLTFSVPISFKSNKFDEIKLNLNAPEYKVPAQNPLSGKLSGIQLNK